MTLDEARQKLWDLSLLHGGDASDEAVRVLVERLDALERVAAAAEAYLEVQGGLGDDEARAALCDALAALRESEGGT